MDFHWIKNNVSNSSSQKMEVSFTSVLGIMQKKNRNAMKKKKTMLVYRNQ